MRALIAHTAQRVKTVAVLVDPGDDLLAAIRTAAPDYLQLHGVASLARIQEIATRTEKPIISAVAVQSPHDLTLAATLEEISTHLLFDAAQAGSGHAFDWGLLKNLALKKPWFLAGGLTAETVAGAIRITQAPMVDVSSGIEASPGKKSLEKIAAFNAAVLQPSA